MKNTSSLALVLALLASACSASVSGSMGAAMPETDAATSTDTASADAGNIVRSDTTDASTSTNVPAGTPLWWVVDMPAGDRVSVFQVTRWYGAMASEVLHVQYLFDNPIEVAGGMHAFVYGHESTMPYSVSLEMRVGNATEPANSMAVVESTTGRCRQVIPGIRPTTRDFRPVSYELLAEPYSTGTGRATYCFVHILGWGCPPGRSLNTDGTCVDRR